MTAHLPDAPVLIHAGEQGSGKTHALKRCVALHVAARRFLIVDAEEDWLDEAGRASWLAGTGVRPARAREAGGADRALSQGYRVVVVQPIDTDEEEDAALIDQCARLALVHNVTLVIPEAWMYLPEGGRIGKNLRRLIATYRHKPGRGLWMDSQSLADVRKRATRACRIIRLFALSGDNETKALRRLGGPELAKAVAECARRYAPRDHGGDDTPGWFVEIDPRSRVPPFPLRRA